MNVYDLRMHDDGQWVRFFTKDSVVLPLNREEEAEFFARHKRIGIDRNKDSTPKHSGAKLGDFSNLSLSHHPVFSDRARQVLLPSLSGLGQWIELCSDEATYWLFWITNVVDALDHEDSSFKLFNDGRVMRIATFAFKQDVVKEQILFAVPQRPSSHRFVTDQFVDLVRQHRLTGFSFEWLWSTDKGPRPEGMKDWEKPRITGLEGLEDESSA